MVAVKRKFSRRPLTYVSPRMPLSQEWAPQRSIYPADRDLAMPMQACRVDFKLPSRDLSASQTTQLLPRKGILVFALAPPRDCKSEKHQCGAIETHDVLTIEPSDTRAEP